jgi:D-arginine dehydrogenase
MPTVSTDFIVVGAGIAGASVAYELSVQGKVAILEMEPQPGYHSTGRSAAIMSENYGPALWSRLVSASRSFLESPPEGFTEVPLVSPRGALFLAHDDEVQALHAQESEMRRRGATIEIMSARDALRHCPVLRPETFALALYEPDCMDIDTNALLTAYLKAFRARGGTLLTEARADKIAHTAGQWTVSTPKGDFAAPVLVNAAGGWVQQVAALAGLPHRNVVPFRRTAATFDPPAGSDISRWPMTFDLAETFYFKPEAGRVMVSPVDMAPSEPCDVQADELEVAIAVDRIRQFTTMDVRTIKHKWGGLRTFAPDHEPVIGPDPAEPSFIWLAGQGGNGVMGGAAAARLAASFATGGGVPQDLANLGIAIEAVSPGRACILQQPGSYRSNVERSS